MSDENETDDPAPEREARSGREFSMEAAIPFIPSRAISVSTHPGQMALTRISRSANSCAKARTMPSVPALLAQYAVYPGTPKRARHEEITIAWRGSGPGAAYFSNARIVP